MQKTRCAWRRCRLKEQMGCIGLEGQIAELVDDQQFRFAKVSKAVFEPALAMRLSELGHQGRRRHKQHCLAGQDRLAPDRHYQMRFADARRGRDMVPDARGRTRRFTTLFIRTAGGESQLCGVIRSAASRCW